MRTSTLRLLSLALAALALFAGTPTASAQGVTTAAINGTVIDEAGIGLPAASVLAVHEPSGTRYGISTRSDGQFNLRNLRVGGPYTLTVSFVGYTTVQITDIVLELSENQQIDVQLTPENATIGEAVVVGQSNAIISSSNIGTGTNVSEEEIERLPTISRSLTDFTRLTPQFSQVGSGSEAGTSVGGTASRYNNIQVDGAALNDAFGLESSGSPGGSSGTQPISLDAVSEFRVAIAPYDVTQGGFTGGNINVITRSGTNTFTGSVYGLGRNQDLVGSDTDGEAFGDFTDVTYGGRLGGPILQDKLFFFGSVEIGDTNEPILGTFNDVASAQEIQSILSSQYGRETGTIGAFDAATTSTKLFGRLDYNLSPANKLTARFNYVQGRKDDGISRSSSFYTLEDRLYTRQNTNTSSVVELKSILGQNMANLFRASLQTNRQPSVLEFPAFPSIEIRGLGTDGRSTVVAGPDQFRGANNIDADVLEIANDFNYFVGDHVVTVGTQNTFSQFSNLFIRNFYGYYRFNNLEDFRNARPSRYERNYSAIPGEDRPLADFAYANFSVYAQDEWSGIENLKLTAGLRVDMANYFDSPSQAYAASNGASFESLFGFDNTEVPNGNPVFQPRFGFNYSLPESQTQVRGGTGLFNGSNPAVWISNSFSNDGTLLGGVAVFSANDIAAAGGFRTDPANQYTAADFGFAEGSAEINLTDPGFKSPTVWRSNLAVDQQLPGGFVATGELLYTDVVDGVQWKSLNRTPFVLDPSTVDGRTGVRRAAISGDYQDVIVLTNTDKGYAVNATAQLQKPIGTGAMPALGTSLSYTFGKVNDINSVTSSQARSNVRDLTVGLDVNDPPSTTSNFEVAHRVLATASYRIAYADRFATTLSLIYDGQAGRPYSFVYFRGDDLNGDGFDRADLAYIPADRSEVEMSDADYAAFDAFIEANEDLRSQRGQIFERNSTRAPWLHFLDARIAQSIETITGQDVEITLDIQNVFDLLGSDLGDVETVGDRFELVDFQGYTADGRQILEFETPDTVAEVSDFASRWRMQLGLRYNF
ncbi:carboxypeptidase regulatory-like domain-containing protein [Rubrivirga sp. IMCC43871]|uniref:TonB-dependent receptor n=1 Tax=Rubrivirga sp. IMCC43871 TaxID=3391575 RepID=UPI0039903414